MIVGCGMFGYVRVYQPELKMGEFEQYRGVYCSLCKSLGKRYGFFARMTLSYDFTFLAVVHMALQKGCAGFRMGRCALNPLKKRMCCRENEEIAYAADAAVLLLYHKLRDTVADSGLLKGLGARFLLFFISRAKKKAAAVQPELDCVRRARRAHEPERAAGGAGKSATPRHGRGGGAVRPDAGGYGCRRRPGRPGTLGTGSVRLLSRPLDLSHRRGG